MQEASEMSADRPSPPWGPEHLFAALVGVFGLFFVFCLPPGQGADEPSHYPRAYHISEGHFFPQMFRDCEWGGGDLPRSVQWMIGVCFHVGNNSQAQVTLEQFRPLLRMRERPHDRLSIIYPTAAHYSFVPYIPAASAILITRSVGLRMLPQFYAGRLANLALAVVALFWAIRLCPVLKMAFGMTAMIPIAVQQCSTYSPDASTLSTACLLTSLLLRLALQAGPPIGRGTVAALIGLTVWLTLCKFPYVILLLLYAAVPVARIGGARRYVALAAALGLAVACCMPLVQHGRQYVPNRMIGPANSNIDCQIASIKQDPLRFAQVLVATVADHSPMWVDQLGHLGWQDTHVNRLALHLYLLMLVLVALADGAAWMAPPSRLKWAAVSACGICLVVILTSCYIAGSTPESQLIYGPQGRYFLPLVPLLMLALSNRAFQVRADARFVLSLAAASGGAVLLVTVVTVIRRYYISTDLELRISPAAFAAALALVVAVTAWASRRWGSSAVLDASGGHGGG